MEEKPAQNQLIDLHQINSPKNTTLPNHEPTKCSFKNNGLIKAYAANTNQGVYRNYNEDRVSIILNITQPVDKQLPSNTRWPSINYFGVFDGHGGYSCADFLRDNLHKYIINDPYFPQDIEKSIANGFKQCEHEFIQIAISAEKLERSGSCANVCLFVNSLCYIANVGDSRSILSRQQGTVIHDLSIDHKPEQESEQNRIIANGGKVYQTQMDNIVGPKRIYPGRLSVSRAFGDVDAKLEQFGGKQGVLIAEPDITIINVNPQKDDFIIIGCDGIFDYLTTQQIIRHIWNTDFNHYIQNNDNLHKISGDIVEKVIQKAIEAQSMDNLTVVMISLPNLANYVTTLQQNSQIDHHPVQTLDLQSQHSNFKDQKYTRTRDQQNQDQDQKQDSESSSNFRLSKAFLQKLKSESTIRLKENRLQNNMNSQELLQNRTNQDNSYKQQDDANEYDQNKSTKIKMFRLNNLRKLSIGNINMPNKEQEHTVKSTKSQQTSNRIVFRSKEKTPKGYNKESIQEMFNKYQLKNQSQRFQFNKVEQHENEKENLNSNRFTRTCNNHFRNKGSLKKDEKKNEQVKGQRQNFYQIEENKYRRQPKVEIKSMNLKMMSPQELMYGNINRRML